MYLYLQEMGGAKAKTKKKKQKTPSSASSSAQWVHQELFTLPDRHVETLQDKEEATWKSK